MKKGCFFRIFVLIVIFAAVAVYLFDKYAVEFFEDSKQKITLEFIDQFKEKITNITEDSPGDSLLTSIETKLNQFKSEVLVESNQKFEEIIADIYDYIESNSDNLNNVESLKQIVEDYEKEKKTEIKVGLTVIAGIVIFVYLLGWAKNFSFTDKFAEVSVEFNTVAGLSEGDIVTVNGVKKGYVDRINLNNNTAITFLHIDNDVMIKEDAKFYVMMLDLMGGKKVEVYPGNSMQNLDYSAVHKGEFVGDISTALASLSAIEGDVVVLIKEVKEAVQNLNRTYLSEEFTSNFDENLRNLNKLLNSLSSLISKNEDGIEDLIINSNDLVRKGNEILDENRDDISTGINSLNTFLSNSNNLVIKIDSLIAETRKMENNAGKLLYDSKLFNDLNDTMKKTSELINLLLEQLKDEGINVDANIF